MAQEWVSDLFSTGSVASLVQQLSGKISGANTASECNRPAKSVTPLAANFEGEVHRGVISDYVSSSAFSCRVWIETTD